MGERAEKLREIVLGRVKENVKKNWITIAFIIGSVLIAVWNLWSLLATGIISFTSFSLLILDIINLPIVISIQIIWNGKYRVLSNEKVIDTQNHNNEVTQLKALHAVNIQIELLKKDNEHLKIVQQLQNTISDLSEQLHKIEDKYIKQLSHEREIAKYSLQLAARDENIRQAICSNKDWSDKNDLIGIIESEKKRKEDENEPNPDS